MKPYTCLYVGLSLLFLAFAMSISALGVLPVTLHLSGFNTETTVLAFSLAGAVGLLLVMHFLALRSQAKVYAKTWRVSKVVGVNPGKTVFHATRYKIMSGWGWRERIKYSLVDSVDPKNKKVTLRGRYRQNIENGNAVILYFPHAKTSNRWILRHEVCNAHNQSCTVREEVFDENALNQEKADEMFINWASRYVYGREAADPLKYS